MAALPLADATIGTTAIAVFTNQIRIAGAPDRALCIVRMM